jgi:uncharacterized protein YodC (DUF2158 family)
MSDDLRVGDVVKLKSGGPPMTLVGIYGGTFADVVWFDNAGILRRLNKEEGYIPITFLERAEPARPAQLVGQKRR